MKTIKYLTLENNELAFTESNGEDVIITNNFNQCLKWNVLPRACL